MESEDHLGSIGIRKPTHEIKRMDEEDESIKVKLYNKVVESVSEMLSEKGITITELELKMLVEAAVGEFNKVFETPE